MANGADQTRTRKLSSHMVSPVTGVGGIVAYHAERVAGCGSCIVCVSCTVSACFTFGKRNHAASRMPRSVRLTVAPRTVGKTSMVVGARFDQTK